MQALLGVLGGVVGSAAKFWIDKKIKAHEDRLSERDVLLLRCIEKENGLAKFNYREGHPAVFECAYEDLDFPEQNFRFEDLGEVARMKDLGFIEEIDRDRTTQREVLYRMTGKGWAFLKGHQKAKTWSLLGRIHFPWR